MFQAEVVEKIKTFYV